MNYISHWMVLVLLLQRIHWCDSGGHEIIDQRPVYPKDQETHAITMESKPMDSLAELSNWNPPSGTILNRSNQKLCKRKVSLDGTKQILCHDMMNGYLVSDRYTQGFRSVLEYSESITKDQSEIDLAYNFIHWPLIDIFIYFTHHRISIPPVGWIDAAHRNGVKIMGTFITEWDGGVIDSCLLVDGPPQVSNRESFFIDKLVEMAKYYRFDGWFINIESPLINKDYTGKFTRFLRALTNEMHKQLPGSLVIWYDSVIESGELVWQNELNEKNNMFFQSCDGIFLNYKWNPTMLKNSLAIAKERNHDVFVGTDVWGRGTFGDGKLNTPIGIKESINSNLSTALFAPAWTHEDSKSSFRSIHSTDLSLWWGSGGTHKNLIENGSAEMGDFSGWDLERISQDGWAVSNDGDGLYGKGRAFVASHKWCNMSTEINLLSKGFSESVLDQSPVIEFEFYYSGTGPNYNDELQVRFEIRDTNHVSIYTFESGLITATDKYQRYHKIFSYYPSGARYIYCDFDGKDVEQWAGNFGTRVTGIYANLLTHRRNNSGDSIGTFIKERLAVTSLPFVSHFNIGKGNRYYLNGVLVDNNPWANMSMMDVIGCHDNHHYWRGSELVTPSITLDHAFEGGSSLCLRGKLNSIQSESNIRVDMNESNPGINNFSYSRIPIYKTDVDMKECLDQDLLEIKFTWKNDSLGGIVNNNSRIQIVLVFESYHINNTQRIYLVLYPKNQNYLPIYDSSDVKNNINVQYIPGTSEETLNNWNISIFELHKSDIDKVGNNTILSLKDIQIIGWNQFDNNNFNQNNNFNILIGELSIIKKPATTTTTSIIQPRLKVSDSELKKLYRRFQMLDKDGSGTLTTDEFLSIPDLALNPLLERVLQIFDENKDNEIQFSEFVNTLSTLSDKGTREQKLKFLFQVYDMDCDGYISNGELFQVLKMMVGNNLNDIQLQQIVDKTIIEGDKDKDGKISFEEFIDIIGAQEGVEEKLSVSWSE
eukprot:gene6147-7657_t